MATPGTPEWADDVKALRKRLMDEMRPFMQAERDKLLRRGRAKPRNRREAAIFAKDLLKPPQTESKEDQ